MVSAESPAPRTTAAARMWNHLLNMPNPMTRLTPAGNLIQIVPELDWGSEYQERPGPSLSPDLPDQETGSVISARVAPLSAMAEFGPIGQNDGKQRAATRSIAQRVDLDRDLVTRLDD